MIQNLSFNKYHEIAMFEKESHGVGLGNGFLTNKSGREIAIYLSSSLLEDNVTRPLNKKERHYLAYYLMAHLLQKSMMKKNFTS